MDPASLGPDVLAPGTILGRYEIRRLIGRGGMGSVYEGLHRDLKKRVAIKTLQAALAANPDAKVRFLREGEAASRIRHPHVVDVTDVGAEGAVIFLVMEYLEGEDLGKLIGRQGAMEISATADIMLPVIAAIGSAHDQGVIHRDLKPENIFLARGQMGGIQPKVLDFGISKVSGDLRTMALTGTGATFGTTFYLPPEQLRGAKQADARSDQYALGTILYECLTGQRAFEGDNLYAVLKDIAESRYRPAITLRPDLPPALDAIVNQAMNLEPSTRFETTRHLGAALLEYASPQVRMMWAPFFATQPSWSGLAGGAPGSIDSYGSGPLTPPPPSYNRTPPPDASSGGSPSSRHLRATPPPTDPPRASAGGTRILPSGATPFPRAASAGGGGRRIESSSTFNHATGESASFESMQPARSRLPLVVGLGVLVAIGVVFLVMRPDQTGDRNTTPIVAPDPKTYRVEVVTEPGNATIELDGQLVGTGAFARKLPLDGSEHEIVAKARGHRNASVRFTDVAPPRDLVLEAIAVAEPPKPPPPPIAGDSDNSGGNKNDRPTGASKNNKGDRTGKGGKNGGGKSGGRRRRRARHRTGRQRRRALRQRAKHAQDAGQTHRQGRQGWRHRRAAQQRAHRRLTFGAGAVIARAFHAGSFPFRYCASRSFAGKLRRAAMGANRLGFAGLALAAGMLATSAQAGCSHAPAAPDAPPCATPEPLRVQLRASARLNPGEKGEALATVVRVYQVKGISKLTGASFDDLLDHDKDTFGDDLLVVQELTVNPGDLVAPPVARHADANYVVAIALFRQPVGTNWRAVKKLWPPNADHCHAGSKGGSPAETRFFLDENRIELRDSEDAMKPPQRVVWSEGMLVSPQHLQQQDIYHERLLDERIAALAPYRWGVVAAEIDAGALGTDQLRVTKFVGILPDGLFLGFEGGDPECPPARPVGANFPPTQPACDVYLGVPKEREGVPSVSAEENATGPGRSTKSARARFRAISRTVSDLTGNAADLSMAFAHRNTVILFGSESREDFETVKIAEVVRDGRGALIINETYIPPTPRIDASPFLMGRVRHILAMLVTKQRQLAGDRRQRDGASIEFAAGDVTRFLQLSTVNTAIPLLTYAASNGEISPNQLYLLLVQVAGQLATFGSDVDPSKLPLFQYTDLRATFEELFARVINLLRTTVREAYMTVSMEVVDGIHLGKLDDDRLLAAPQYVLAVRSEIPEAQLAQRLPGLCKISARTQLPQVIRAAATPGVPIQVTHRPPSEIPVKSGVTYFNLSLQNEYWKQILEERLVSIYLPPPFGPQHVKLELLAIPKA